MACFVVPVAQAVVVSVAARVMKSKEIKLCATQSGVESDFCKRSAPLPFSKKLGWLSKLLWGGSSLLAFEHLWSGEISPVYPFLTAAKDPSQLAVILKETAAVGSSMSLLVTAVWVGMLVYARSVERKTPEISEKGR